ncbi:secretory phospholipase A2 receptor isoform X1 [Bufo gargarizans]|uniref:secretory phospholipase A2 receptor isoform X1 n=1 Tax=Bufo gargarizans TaxID=30331 RepID=UPI001CF4BC71|nr:secretory phospholipase A2 receptor isoform X1 [Bufo gargarizans]
MSALLLCIAGLLCGILVPPWCTSAQHPREIRESCDLLWEENNVTHFCYQFHLQSALSWKAARESCQAQGGDLLSIMNLAEQNHISEKLKNVDTMVWIGLNQLDGLFGWQWSDGAALAFVNWKTNSSPWVHERKHCGTYSAGGEHKWHSTECESKLPYACKKYLTPRQRELYEHWRYYPTQCASDWIPYNRRCCRLQKEELGWSEASAACHSDGGELMSANSLADVEFLVHLLDDENTSEAWIGMSSSHSDPAEFQWSDGSAVTFTSWQRHEPKITLEDSDLCVSVHNADGNWKVRPCRRKLSSVCKKPGLSETVDDNDDDKCAEGWVRHAAYCYGTDLRDKTFMQAVEDSRCHPATISNRFEQAFINSLISNKLIPGDSYFWIALQDINKTGEYSWLVNGKEDGDVGFTHWDTQEPSHNGGCVVLSSGSSMGHWKVKDCERFSAKSLCKLPLTANVERELNLHEGFMDQTCAPSWDTEPHLHHCYKVFHHEKLMRKRTWQEAEDTCQDFGAHLVSLSNLEEEQFVEELISSMFNGDGKRKFWIGFNKRNPSSKNSWEWSDKSPVVSSFWHDAYPSDVSMCCAAYGADKQLMPLNCNTQEEWICKIPKGVIPKTPDWHIQDIPWVFHHGHNYCFYDINAHFDVARFICDMMQSGITSILTEEEQAFIHRRIKKISKEKQKWWIGLENENDGLQRWGDGSFVTYSNWKTDAQRDVNSSTTAGARQCAYIESDTGLWSFSDCLSPNSAICKTNLIFKMEKHYTPVDNDHDQEYEICPEDWLYYGNKCFFVYKDGKMDWYSASNYCREHGGGLATITNGIEQAVIVMQLFGEKSGFWIGVGKTDYDLWENGTAKTYNNWTPAQYHHKDVNDQDRLCALISANQNVHPTGKWYLEKCSPKGYGFICENELDISDLAISSSDMFPVSETMEYGDKTYRIISGNMSWYDASAECQEYGGNLASITDQYHQAFVTILVHRLGYPHWIGSLSADSNDDFKRIDGATSQFTSWADEESPSDGNCVYTDTSGYWRAEDCDTELQGALCLPTTGYSVSIFATGIYTARKHFIIPIAVLSTMLITISLWYLLKRKRCLSSQNIERLHYTPSTPETDDVK